MISLGELEFLRRRGFGSGLAKSGSGPGKFGNVVQCNYVQAGAYVRGCDDVYADFEPSQVARQTAIWHGGGNWGDLCKYGSREERFRNCIPSNCPRQHREAPPKPSVSLSIFFLRAPGPGEKMFVVFLYDFNGMIVYADLPLIPFLPSENSNKVTF